MSQRPSDTRVPLPPKDAEMRTMACQYCIVGCGYKSYVWPTTAAPGGPKAGENALGVDYPTKALSGEWVSPAYHNIIRRKDGRDYHLVLIPDEQCVVNHGNNSSRGGSNAQSVWSPYGPTADRFSMPLVRVGDTQQPIGWGPMIRILAAVIGHAVKSDGPAALGFRMAVYHSYEAVYGMTKFFFGSIGTPNAAVHNRASWGGETTAMSDTGLGYAFPTSFDDGASADTVVAWGANLYECQDTYFTQRIMPGGAKLVVADPRKILLANYAEKHGGVHLQLKPGTDVVLINAIAREIVAKGWHDSAFLAKMASKGEIAAEPNWRQQMFGQTPQEYLALLQQPVYALDQASAATGVPVAAIRKAAALIAQPKNGQPRKTLLMFEKGLIWGVNYENVAAFSNLGLLTGNVGSLGRGVTRAGGHQGGYMAGYHYPIDRATDTYKGNKVPNYVDEHIVKGEVKVYYCVGCNPMGMTNSSEYMRRHIERLTHVTPGPATADEAEVVRALVKRIDSGGLVVIAQNIFPNLTTEMADIVLPAASWGESPGARSNGERRMRLLSQFMDPPGESLPDWEILARVGRAMGFSGYDWKSADDVFEEAALASRGGPKDFSALVAYAKQHGKTPHEVLGGLGTDGIQLPVRVVNGKLEGTPRLYADHRFATKSGKAMFIKADWADVEPIYSQLLPDPSRGEVWILNGRIDELWQTMYTAKRIPLFEHRWPTNIVEINPADARRMGIANGDMLSVSSTHIFTIQPGVFDTGSLTAAAYVSDIVPEGLFWVNFAYPSQWANSIAPRWVHPVNPLPPYKLTRAKIAKIGRTDLTAHMTFKPRNLSL